MHLRSLLGIGWKKTTRFSGPRVLGPAIEPNIASNEADLFIRRTQSNSLKTTASSENVKADLLVVPLSQSSERVKTPLDIENCTRSELTEKAKSSVLAAVWGEGCPDDALQLLSGIISYYPELTDTYVMRSIVRAKMGNLVGAIEDCDVILCLEPNNEFALLHRVTFVRDSRINGTSSKYIENVLDGVEYAEKTATTPYSIILKHAGLALFRPSQNHFEEVEHLVAATPAYRGAKVVLASMYFARWLHTGDKLCGAEASRLAVEIQKDWPNDKVAMSVLWYLKGHLGQGDLSKSNPRGYNFSLQAPLYDRERILADVFFCFPLEEQNKSIKEMVEDIGAVKVKAQ